MLLAIRVRSKSNVGSRCSIEICSRFVPQPTSRSTQYERANHSRFPFTNVMGRVRECLTLMPSQPANAVCWRAPARHHWFMDVIPGVPFATRAHASNVTGYRMFIVHSNRSGWRMIDARVRHEDGETNVCDAG